MLKSLPVERHKIGTSASLKRNKTIIKTIYKQLCEPYEGLFWYLLVENVTVLFKRGYNRLPFSVRDECEVEPQKSQAVFYSLIEYAKCEKGKGAQRGEK